MAGLADISRTFLRLPPSRRRQPPPSTTWPRSSLPKRDGVVHDRADQWPPGWQVVRSLPLTQMVCTERRHAAAASFLTLGEPDVAEMLALTAATEPGPFLPATIRMGRYLGVREAGRLIAMAGERLQPDGLTEISAVCTDPRFPRPRPRPGPRPLLAPADLRGRPHSVPARQTRQRSGDRTLPGARLYHPPHDAVDAPRPRVTAIRRVIRAAAAPVTAQPGRRRARATHGRL